MTKKSAKPIIIKKVKKGGHGGHHGGSWKVAYADFVTAMMAFFMVMWILGMDEHTRQAVEGYFTNPAGYRKGYGSGTSPIANGQTPTRTAEAQVKMIIHRAEEQAFKEAAGKIKDKLEGAGKAGKLGAAKFEVTVTEEGLRIELIEEGAGDTFFPSGSASVKPGLREGIEIIGSELIPLHNAVIVEGHTDATRYSANASYTNWELSADRANAARRILEESGLAAARIREVRGLADTRPRIPENPFAAENRRISLMLPFSNAGTAAPAAKDAASANGHTATAPVVPPTAESAAATAPAKPAPAAPAGVKRP